MADVINIIIINRLVKGKRYLHIYHHGTGSSYLISDKKEVNVPLKINTKKDFLTITIAGEPSHMWNGCRATLPSWLDFDFLATDAVTLNHHGCGERTVIIIPPGLPNWRLKVTPKKDSLSRYENSHQGTKAPRNTKGFIIKKLVSWRAVSWQQKFSSSPGVGKALMRNRQVKELDENSSHQIIISDDDN